MIQNLDVATQINSLMLEISERVNESVRLVQAECTDEEFKRYRLAAGYILGSAYTDVLVPLYDEHPDLKPDRYGRRGDVGPGALASMDVARSSELGQPCVQTMRLDAMTRTAYSIAELSGRQACRVPTLAQGQNHILAAPLSLQRARHQEAGVDPGRARLEKRVGHTSTSNSTSEGTDQRGFQHPESKTDQRVSVDPLLDWWRWREPTRGVR